MADTKLSDFASISSADGTEILPVLQGGANKKVLLSAIKTSYLDTLYQPLISVVPNTGAATPASTDSGTVYTNEGDSDGSSVTLPSAIAGLQFTICVQANQTLTVTANADDTIRVGTSVTAAAGSITSNVVGSSITLIAINATEWFATAASGTWTL